MGLGIGVKCEGCDDQLRYDTDAEEIAKYTVIDAEGQQHIIGKPVLCHRCTKTIRRLYGKE